MRMLDKIKKLGLKVKCGIGWHNGTYAHIAGEPQCFFAKTCPDCGKVYYRKKTQIRGMVLPISRSL